MEWNEERIEALTKMWREGLSASQVARQLGGVSRSAVIGKVHRLGIAGRDAPARPHNVGGRPSTRVRASAGGVRRAPSLAPRAPRIVAPAQPRVVFNVPPTATIQTLTEHACRWPIGEPDQPGFGFCGRLRTGPGAYCAGHAPMAVRRRDAPMKSNEIERIVSRFVEGARHDPIGGEIQLREIA
ncbi:MAG TPA: GcrA family cell cycle regulator [Caulobacteraceae bacterium]|nr:GcrA family cell cycle regulator [Caulobacteraceae bacterium]